MDLVKLMLVRWKLGFALAFTGMCAFAAVRRQLDMTVLPVFSGLFLLAMASAALNLLQESGADSRMDRTVSRQDVLKRIPPGRAIAAIAVVLCIGLYLIYTGSRAVHGRELLAPALALSAAVIYNLIYTPLKKKSAFSFFPGAVNGAMPVLVGWTAAGGRLDLTAIWVLFGFLFLWQLPHYFILLYKHAAEYEQAGFVTFFAGLKPSRFAGLIYAGLAGTGILAAWLSFSGLVPRWPFKAVILGLTLWVLRDFLKIRDPGWKDLASGRAFLKINVYGLAVFICVLLSAALFGPASFSEVALRLF